MKLNWPLCAYYGLPASEERDRLGITDPERFRDFGERVAAGDLDIARRELAAAAERFDSIDSPLPEQPDREAAEAWLLGVRRAFWDHS